MGAVTQPEQELTALRKELEALKEGQKAIQQQRNAVIHYCDWDLFPTMRSPKWVRFVQLEFEASWLDPTPMISPVGK